jgi:hypothetical protein
MRDALGLLFPRGYLWRMTGEIAALLDGVALSLDRVKAYADQIRRESIPSSAVDTLPEWHDALYVKYDENISPDDQRRRLGAMFSADGNATGPGLEYQLAKEFHDLSVVEGGPNAFDVTGTVATEQDSLRVGAILARYAHLHLTPGTGGLEVLSVNGTCRCGAAVCGIAICGNVPS